MPRPFTELSPWIDDGLPVLNGLSWLCQGLSADAVMSRERLEEIQIDTSPKGSDGSQRLRDDPPEDIAVRPITVFIAGLALPFIAFGHGLAP